MKAAIHAPNVSWEVCSSDQVFPNGDVSPSTALSVLPSVIEKSNRTVIVHGRADFRYIAEGTRVLIQKYMVFPYISLNSFDRLYAA